MNTMGKRSIVIGAAASLAFTAAFSAVTSTSVSALESKNRLWGKDRYDTAADICKNAWTASDYAVIVRGDEFADALCAAPLAQKFNAPILLTEKDSVNTKVKEELKRLNVKHILVVGGTGAISQNVEKELNTIAPVERITGSDRYDTSVNIAGKLGISSSVVLATGENYADAISIAPIAAMKNMPIILVSSKGLTEVQKNYLSNSNIKKTYIIGGGSVISDEILKQVHGGVRLGGSNRYDTNARVIDEFKNELNFDNIYTVIGSGSKKDGFADALSGAPLAARNSAPIILTNNSVPAEIGQEIKSLNGQLSPKTAITAFGGEAVVPDKVIDEIKKDAAVTYEDYKNVASQTSVSGNVRIAENGTEFKNTTVTGNVYVYGDDVKLTNVTVKGILFIDPGENGSIHLENVKADKIKLRSGGSNSIHIQGVAADSFEIESNDTDRSVRIVTEGSNDIKSTIIRSNALIDTVSGSIGSIEIDSSGVNNKNIELSGKFDSAIIIRAAASIKVNEGAQVSIIELPEDASGAGVSLTGTGEVKNIQVKNDSAKVSVPEGYKVTGSIEAVDKGCIDTKDTDLQSKVEVKDPGSMGNPQVPVPGSGSGEVIPEKPVTVVVRDDTFTIYVTTDAANKGDATLKIIDGMGNVKDFGQQTLKNGRCQFSGTLPSGIYTAVVKIPGIEAPISSDEFTINISYPVTTNVGVNGKVTITANCPNELDKTPVTIQILDKVHGDREAYIGQGIVMNGKCVFTITLDAGTYYGFIKIGDKDTINVLTFTVAP